jgi:hypothetical protein
MVESLALPIALTGVAVAQRKAWPQLLGHHLDH